MADFEYRVVWKRHGGLAASYQHYQTLEGAEAKVARLRGEFNVELDGGYGTVHVQPGTEWLEERGVAPLEWIRIDARPVGDWQRGEALGVAADG